MADLDPLDGLSFDDVDHDREPSNSGDHTWVARYRTQCPACEEWIVPDVDVVRWAEDLRLRCVEHAECKVDTPPEPCTACWLVHPEGACDRG